MMSQRRASGKILMMFGALLLLLVSCGNVQNSTTGGGSTAVAPTNTASASATVILKGIPTPGTVTPVPTLPPGSATVTSGQVMIAATKSSYSSNEPIDATISNGLSSTITVTDHQSVCTILILQMQVGNQWVDQAPCRLSTVTRQLIIPAHTLRTQSLVPGSVSWAGGRYRLVLRYTMGTADTSTPGSFTSVYAPTFVIA